MLWFIFNYFHLYLNVVFQGPMGTLNAQESIESSETVLVDHNWWKHAVFYQIYPRSFMDSDDDGIGDLQGVISKLPYLAETGITATWLSPIFQSPMVDFGYDVSDFTAIQHEYGTMGDFEELILQAQNLNVKIILDFVPNHSSDQCEWFIKSAKREAGYEDFYIWSDGKINEQGEREPPNNWQSVFYGSAWTWHPVREQYYYHQFVKEQPDLNYRNSAVVAAMDKVLLFWLHKGVNGFRVDAVNHLFEDPDLRDEPLTGKTDDPKSFDYTQHIYTQNLPEVYDILYHWRALLDNYSATHGGPERILMTEAYADIKILMEYYENEEGVKGPQFPFNFILLTELNEKSDARDFAFNINKWLTYMPRNHTANWVMGNHDLPRIASRFGVASVDAINMLIMTLPGVAVTYNGEEIGMEDFRDMSWEDTVDPRGRNVGQVKYKEYSRDPVRTPFQWNSEKNAGFSKADKTWLPVNPNYKELNLELQKEANRSHYKIYKELVQLRRLPVLQLGRTRIEVINLNVFAVIRSLKGDTSIMTLINVGGKEEIVNLLDILDDVKQLTVMVASVNSSYENGTIISLEENKSLMMVPKEAVVCMIE